MMSLRRDVTVENPYAARAFARTVAKIANTRMLKDVHVRNYWKIILLVLRPVSTNSKIPINRCRPSLSMIHTVFPGKALPRNRPSPSQLLTNGPHPLQAVTKRHCASVLTGFLIRCLQILLSLLLEAILLILEALYQHLKTSTLGGALKSLQCILHNSCKFQIAIVQFSLMLTPACQCGQFLGGR